MGDDPGIFRLGQCNLKVFIGGRQDQLVIGGMISEMLEMMEKDQAREWRSF